MFLKTVLLITAVLASTHSTYAETDKVVCYFASWARYRPNGGAFVPENIDPRICTHVNYAFLGVNPDGSLKILDSWSEIDLGGLAHVESLKYANPDLKVLVSIGGWNAGNEFLNGIAASSQLRANLIASCISFLEEWGYDGIDIDWQYPKDSDKSNFVKLLQEMRSAFDSAGYIISIAVPGKPLLSYDVPAINKVVDLIHVMVYGFHIPEEGRTGLNSPLHGVWSVNTSVATWIYLGVEPSKLTIVVPFYGQTYSLLDESNHEIGAAGSTGIGGPYTKSPGVLGYNEICEFYDDWTTVWDEEGQAPYKYQGNNWVSYDDPESIGLKAKFAKDNGLAGVGIWSIDTDDFRGSCGTQQPLLQAIKDNL